MTTSFICVFLAFLLAYVPKAAAVIFAGAGARPATKRAAKGWAARAIVAHRDALGTFGPFAAGVVIAHLAGLDPYRAGLLAMTFVGARGLHVVASLAGLDYLRHTSWAVGFASTAMLYVLPWLL
jgi:uncharacterized MAPEG superfamily protein